jgi:hypothetical protein
MRVVRRKTDVSEEHIASISKAKKKAEAGGRIQVGEPLSNCTALQSRTLFPATAVRNSVLA